jgi:TetR/AcrR family transcriptional regulator, cholesterol catabolism regulator
MAPPTRSRRSRPVTVPGPHNDKQVADRELWTEGRKRIAEAALPLFLRYGYHATPVRVIARAAGISSGSVFNYFSGKDELLEHVLDESQAEAEQSIQEAQSALVASRTAADPVEGFLAVFRRYAEYLDRIHGYVLLAYQEAKSLAPKKRIPLFEREQRIADVLKAAAVPAIEAGLFSGDALDLRVHSLIVIAQAWAVRHWAFAHYRTVADYLDDLEPVVVGVMSRGKAPGVRRSRSKR